MLTIKIPVIPKQFSKTNHDDQFNGEKTMFALQHYPQINLWKGVAYSVCESYYCYFEIKSIGG